MNPQSGQPHPRDARNLAASAAGVLDLSVLNELRELGGDDDPGLILELIEIFLQDAPQRLDEISKGMAASDLKLIERAAHTLKSSSANIGALGLSKICKEMEEIARRRTLDGIPPLYTRSTQVMNDVESALRALKS